MENFQEASHRKQVKQPPLPPKKKKQSSNHDLNRSNENPNITSATVWTQSSCAPNQWLVSVQSSGTDKRCIFVVKSMRGIEKQSKDLETVKHILEALQLKGLLHSKNAKNQMSHQNFVYDRNGESSIVVMKLARSSASRISRGGNELLLSSFRLRPGPHWNTNEVSSVMSPRRDWPVSVQSFDADKWCECRNRKGVRSYLLAIYFYFYFFHPP